MSDLRKSTVQVVVRLDREQVKEIDHMAVAWEVDWDATVARLLGIAVEFVKEPAQQTSSNTLSFFYSPEQGK